MVYEDSTDAVNCRCLAAAGTELVLFFMSTSPPRRTYLIHQQIPNVAAEGLYRLAPIFPLHSLYHHTYIPIPLMKVHSRCMSAIAVEHNNLCIYNNATLLTIAMRWDVLQRGLDSVLPGHSFTLPPQSSKLLWQWVNSLGNCACIRGKQSWGSTTAFNALFASFIQKQLMYEDCEMCPLGSLHLVTIHGKIVTTHLATPPTIEELGDQVTATTNFVRRAQFFRTRNDSSNGQ